MKFINPLLKGSLIQRYKRFLADIILENGEKITAHCANTGSMLGVNVPGSEVWVSPTLNPNRKLKYTWEMIRVGNSLVGVNTTHPNQIVQDAIQRKKITELLGYHSLRREVKYGNNSRIDILLEASKRPDCFVEVKSVTLRRGVWAGFPDAVTTRGTKHLSELTNQVKAGNRAVMFYLVQRAVTASGNSARTPLLNVTLFTSTKQSGRLEASNKISIRELLPYFTSLRRE
jgi:sugar fermentation stimulation protein A